MEEDCTISSIFIRQLRPFSAGKLSPLLDTKHSGCKNASCGQTAQPKQTHTVWLSSNYSIHQERGLDQRENMWAQIGAEKLIYSCSKINTYSIHIGGLNTCKIRNHNIAPFGGNWGYSLCCNYNKQRYDNLILHQWIDLNACTGAFTLSLLLSLYLCRSSFLAPASLFSQLFQISIYIPIESGSGNLFEGMYSSSCKMFAWIISENVHCCVYIWCSQKPKSKSLIKTHLTFRGWCYYGDSINKWLKVKFLRSS